MWYMKPYQYKTREYHFCQDRIIKVDPKDLKFNTEYHIQMSVGSFLDLNDNEFVGISKTDTYNFTTRGECLVLVVKRLV